MKSPVPKRVEAALTFTFPPVTTYQQASFRILVTTVTALVATLATSKSFNCLSTLLKLKSISHASTRTATVGWTLTTASLGKRQERKRSALSGRPFDPVQFPEPHPSASAIALMSTFVWIRTSVARPFHRELASNQKLLQPSRFSACSSLWCTKTKIGIGDFNF